MLTAWCPAVKAGNRSAVGARRDAATVAMLNGRAALSADDLLAVLAEAPLSRITALVAEVTLVFKVRT